MQSGSDATCRTCLKSNGTIVPLTYTCTEHEDIDFATMIMACTSVCIDPKESLPDSICENCIFALTSAYIFKQQCEEVDLLLRKSSCLQTGITRTKNEEDTEETPSKDTKSIAIVDQCLENNVVKVECDEKETLKTDIAFVCVVNDSVEENSEHYEEETKNEIKNCGNRLNPVLSECSTHNSTRKKEKLYKCTQCGKELKTAHGLVYHKKSHTESKNFVCPIENCEKRFLWAPTLKRHMLTHSEKKPYLCSLCGKAYSAPDSLRYHIISHKGERPHLCMYCGKTFKQAVHLKYHISAHTDNTSYVCTECNRIYKGQAQLNRHWRNYCGIGKDPPPARRRAREIAFCAEESV